MASNTLLIDLGNTRLKFAFASDLHAIQAITYDHQAPDFSRLLAHCASQAIDDVWLCSVVPAVADALKMQLRQAGLPAPKQAHSQAQLDRFKSAYAQPERLGTDRFLAMLACAQADAADAPASLIAIVGTALTIDLIDSNALHHGGLIAPGPSLMRRSLQSHAAQLNVAAGQSPQWPTFANNTVDAMDSGCVRACASLIAAQWCLAKDILQTDVRLILSGGGAASLATLLPKHAQLAPDLVLQGLRRYGALAFASRLT